jgi:methyltransferase (TIGR00027 family)
MTTDPVPDSSAVRTALWRALHVQLDAPPHLLDDEIGLAIAAPDEGWRDRGDMHPVGTRPYRVGIVARTRYVEDLLVDAGIGQYVLLGAGLDTFAQRHLELAGRVEVYEIDQPGPQAWKRQRLDERGLGVPANLHLIPVDFETDADWWRALLDAGFDAGAPALVSSSGVSMYLTQEANTDTLRQLAQLGPGSIVAMSFMLPIDLVDAAERPGLEGAARGARASGTPWLSFYTPDEILAVARDAGFAEAEVVATQEIAERLLGDRADGLRASGGESVLIART